jgi:hypothetical protein
MEEAKRAFRLTQTAFSGFTAVIKKRTLNLPPRQICAIS